MKTALRWKISAGQRQRIQMALLRESGMTQPLIAAAMGVSLSTVNRVHMAYDRGGLEALKPKPSGGRNRENMTLETVPPVWALLASGQITMRKVDGWRSLNERPSDQTIDLAA